MFKHIIFVNTSERHWLIHLPRSGWGGGLTILFPIWISELFPLKKKKRKQTPYIRNFWQGVEEGNQFFFLSLKRKAFSFWSKKINLQKQWVTLTKITSAAGNDFIFTLDD